MNKINISVIDQVIYSATPFILFLILSNSTNVSTFAILSSTYTVNILFTSLYQAYLVEPVITHWDKLDNDSRNNIINKKLKVSLQESILVQIISMLFASILLVNTLGFSFSILIYLLLMWISGISTSTVFLSRRLSYLSENSHKSIYISSSYLFISVILITVFIDFINDFSGYFYLFISLSALLTNFITSKQKFDVTVETYSLHLKKIIKDYRIYDLLTVPSGWILSNMYLALGILYLNKIHISEIKTYMMIASIGLAIHPIIHNVYIVKLNNKNKQTIIKYVLPVFGFSFIYLIIFWFLREYIYSLLFPTFIFNSDVYFITLIYSLSGILWLSIATIFRARKQGRAIFYIYLSGALILIFLFFFDSASNVYEAILHHTISSSLSLFTAIYYLLFKYE